MLAAVVAVTALGALRGTEYPLPADHVGRLALPRLARVEGRLAGEPTRWAPDRTRLLIDVERVDGAPVSGRIQAALYGVSPMLTEGQHVAGLLRLHPATGFHNPGTFDYGFYTGLMYKDVRLCVEEGEAMGVPMPLAGAVHQMWLMANAVNGPGSDFTEITKIIETWAGVEVRAKKK